MVVMASAATEVPVNPAFDAYAVAGRDVRETADALDMSVDQVYQAKSRILKRLGRLVEQQTLEEG